MRYLLELLEGFRIAFRAIGANKMRSILTTLGIIIGICAVTAMATVINGIEYNFEQELSKIGADVVYIEKWPWTGGPNFRWWDYINRPDLRPDLADFIQERSRYTIAAAPVFNTSRTIRYGNQTLSRVPVEASTTNYERIYPVDLESGRFYSTLEVRNGANVAVIGADIADRLFPIEEPLGKNVRLAGIRYKVIGVLESSGADAEDSQSEDRQVFIPVSSFKNNFGILRRSASIRVKINSSDQLDLAKDELTGLMRMAHKLDAREGNDFEINEQQSIREQFEPVKNAIFQVGIGLTALALLVGGIGVMNIMFVSVKERTREIGIRKAVGANRRTILLQFLVEAVAICSLGGVIGVAISFALTMVINMFLTAILPAGTIAVAFGICVLVGVVFGLAPAWSAAKAEPIEALRYE